jgi:putative ABC transport system permease protein
MTIGVAAVIILVAVGNGSKMAVQAGINALGTNVLLVQPQAGPGGPGRASASGGFTLTAQDADALQNGFDAPDVKTASPVVNAPGVTLVSGATTYQPATFVGTTPSYAGARDYQVATGQMFTSADVTKHARVAVIGPTVAQNLFAGQSPIGQSILVNGTSFQVVGVTQSKGTNGTQDQDDIVMAPITAVQDSLVGYGSLSSITVQAVSSNKLDAAQAEVQAILTGRHHVTDPTNPGFQVLNQGSVRAVSDQSTSVFTTLLGAVAAISLLVGGIGITNIMLVTVTERTREIGIRKAIGAPKGVILGQFLAESTLLSLVGGGLGVLAGLIGSRFRIVGIKPVIIPESVWGAFAIAVAIGLFFGSYPANRAASLRPIEALRHE